VTSAPLDGIRVCDLSGQLAGAGGTRTLAAFGAEVIRIEDPARQGRWDILRGTYPFVDERRGIDLGGAFNNHNVEKLGITLNTRTERGRGLLAELIRVSDVVTENFSAEVLPSWGFTYERMRELRPAVIYVSNCGFGHTGPHASFRTWGPIVQAVSGLTFTSGLRGQPTAGWGYSYMDHHGAYFMTFAILAALYHRRRTGEGQWIDMSTVETGIALTGPAVLDWSVNGRPMRRDGMPDSNRSQHPAMAPHGIYPADGDDEWVAIACRDDRDWQSLTGVVAEPWCTDDRWATLAGRLDAQDELDELLAAWTRGLGKFDVQSKVLAAGIPCAAVQTPPERIEHDPSTAAWGLWPEVVHDAIGRVRVDGIPVHLSETDWHIERGAPLLGQHNRHVYGTLLGLSDADIDELEIDGVI
jgi:crotonobetainyl-CoA:carnitine CoA-transferase CaiB-like acyl-CoA transferase